MTSRQQSQTMHQPVDDEQPEDQPDGITAEVRKTRIITALAEARKARHHRDCHCRMFDKQFCNAADALWQRALTRELTILYPDQGVAP